MRRDKKAGRVRVAGGLLQGDERGRQGSRWDFDQECLAGDRIV